MSDHLDNLFTTLGTLADRRDELESAMGEPDAVSPEEYQRICREHARLTRLTGPYEEWQQARAALSESEQLLGDPEMADMAKEDIAVQETTIAEAVETIKARLVQADPAADRPAIVEIRAGAGGDEASLFVGDLVRMYEMFCQRQRWTFQILDGHSGEVGGYKECVLQISGEGAYGLLRYESGGHRVQRVPATESQGRVHTSAATVAVLPEAQEIDVPIRPDDLRIDVFRASGAGGQHVNKTESAVRITHEPTGTVVSCQDEKSQAANKERAMKILRARIFDAERQRLAAERAAERKGQVGSGDRSDRIRTYNFPQNRISDHRINYTGYHLDRYMEGHLEELQQAMVDHDKAQILEEWDGAF